MKKITLLISLIILSGGCSMYHINSEDTTLTYYPSKGSSNDVAHIENITKPHEIVAQITVTTERNQKINEVIEKMKREAAILGGDAITNIQTDATGTWKRLPVQEIIGNGYVRANFSASVVVFK